MLKRIWEVVRFGSIAFRKAEELYTIEGHHPELASRVREAMQWLTSVEADYSGLKQLRVAYARNLRPLRLRVAQEGECAYFNTEHVVHIGADFLKQMRYRDMLGTEYAFGLRQILAHEMEHAGQLSIYMNRLCETDLIQFRKAKVAEFVQRPDQLKVISDWVEKVRAASPEHARQCAEQMYDAVVEPAHQWFISQAGNDKRFKSYFKHVEGPAIIAENLVNAKLGKPLRSPSYLGAGYIREQEIQEFFSMLRPAPKSATPQFVKDIIERPPGGATAVDTLSQVARGPRPL